MRESRLENEPYAVVRPYSTWPVAGWLKVQMTIAPFWVMLVAATARTLAAGDAGVGVGVGAAVTVGVGVAVGVGAVLPISTETAAIMAPALTPSEAALEIPPPAE